MIISTHALVSFILVRLNYWCNLQAPSIYSFSLKSTRDNQLDLFNVVFIILGGGILEDKQLFISYIKRCEGKNYCALRKICRDVFMGLCTCTSTCELYFIVYVGLMFKKSQLYCIHYVVFVLNSQFSYFDMHFDFVGDS